MSDSLKTKFFEPQTVALYQKLGDPSWTMIARYYGESDLQYHNDYIRISEPLKISFESLKTNELIQTAVKAIDAQEQELRAELEKKLQQLRDFKSQLLALTYQPEAA